MYVKSVSSSSWTYTAPSSIKMIMMLTNTSPNYGTIYWIPGTSVYESIYTNTNKPSESNLPFTTFSSYTELSKQFGLAGDYQAYYGTYTTIYYTLSVTSDYKTLTLSGPRSKSFKFTILY